MAFDPYAYLEEKESSITPVATVEPPAPVESPEIDFDPEAYLQQKEPAIAHEMPSGETMAGPEHPGAVPDSEYDPEKIEMPMQPIGIPEPTLETPIPEEPVGEFAIKEDFPAFQTEMPAETTGTRIEEEPEKERSFVGNVIESFKRGDTQTMLDYMSYEAMQGKQDWEKVSKIRKEFEKKVKDDPVEANNYLTKSIMGLSGMLSAMFRGVVEGQKSGVAGGLGAAGAAAIGGQAGPQIALPEEIITVPSAFATGTWISLSSLPGRITAGSKISFLLVAPITTTCPLLFNPSINDKS